jgi:hypothetical protein
LRAGDCGIICAFDAAGNILHLPAAGGCDFSDS